MKKIVFTFLILSLLLTFCAPAEKEEAVDPMMAKAEENYTLLCSSCHGEQMQAFVDRRWKHGKGAEELYKSISEGYTDAGMPGWAASLPEEDIKGLVSYIEKGIVEVDKYGFEAESLQSDTIVSEALTFRLDTVASGFYIPWGMAVLPNGEFLVTERSGPMYRVDKEGNKTLIENLPTVRNRDQDGMHEVVLHPDFDNNQLIYLSYANLKVESGDSLTTTMVTRYKLEGNTLTEPLQILEALPYTAAQYHFGSMMTFDQEGYLYVTVGDRGARDINPQNLSLAAGSVHRFNDDGSIPEDNPFVGVDTAVASIYSYGHRNPQGIAVHPETGEIWTHEHGPRGGDELNRIQAGKNYGWPVISYGINYDGTIFTSDLEKEGMEQPVHYWVPSIAPSGLAFVTSDKYGDWKGHALVGSLRFKYLNLCRMEGNKVVDEEMLMKNIGRLRNVEQGPDGYIYICVARPGYVFRLVPIEMEM